MPGITGNSGLSIIECSVLQVTMGCPSLNARYYKWLSVVHHWMPGITSDWVVHHWMSGITSEYGLSIIECPVLQVTLGCPSLNGRYYKWIWVVHHWMSGITSEYGLSIIECPVLQVTLGCPLNARYYKWFWVIHHWMPGITSNSGLSIIECPVLQVTLGCPSLNARYYK